VKPELANLQLIARRILDLYSTLAGDEERYLSLRDVGNCIGSRIRLLEGVAANPADRYVLSTSQSEDFLRTLLDSFGICAATGSTGEKLQKLEAYDVKRLEKKRDMLRRLKERDSQVQDWLFSVLVRGWAELQHLGPLKDLNRGRRFKGSKVADFHVTMGKVNELVECKRIHPAKEDTEVDYDGLIDKLQKKMDEAADQISSTEKELQISGTTRHVLLDVPMVQADKTLKQVRRA